MKKLPILFSLFVATSAALLGCNGAPSESNTHAFAPHEVTYGGDTEATMTRDQFIELAKANYQKSVKYKNAYAILTSDKSLYAESDATNYFEDFDELRFVAILNDEDRNYAMERLMVLLPVNYDVDKYDIQTGDSYRVRRATKYLENNLSLPPNSWSDLNTYYQYKVQGDRLEILFSKDYYPVKATWTYEEATFELKFKYFNVEDLANKPGEVDKETFLIHAYSRANQRMDVNDLKIDITLTNGYIGAEQVPNESGVGTHVEYITGSGTVTDQAKITTPGADKTALPLYGGMMGTASHEFYSEDFDEDQVSFVRIYYGFQSISDLAFNGYQSISRATFTYSYLRKDRIESRFTISPLKAEQRLYRPDEQADEYVLDREYEYEFTNDGLLSRFVTHLNSDIQPGEISALFVYSQQ